MKYLVRMEIGLDNALSIGMVDSYAWHQRLWDCFSSSSETKRNFLTRVDMLESGFRLWLLSPMKPIRPEWCPLESFSIKEISPSFLSHRIYNFDLLANPTKRLSRRDTAGNKIPVGKRIPLTSQDDLREWIIRKAEMGGFKLSEDKPLEIGPMVQNQFRKKEHFGNHGGVRFRGSLVVTDQEKFRETYSKGIGSAKGFGYGLLLLAPVKIK
ncbi:MAG: type I-E CRISPR-associated protein Cas6/Cse3/CasE [Candidatus Aminicenantes bacterium]|nr:type I-E CRISPR-associated protein Cas6/Cse3/CasE [Candidatus Aminicenantes bacterium]